MSEAPLNCWVPLILALAVFVLLLAPTGIGAAGGSTGRFVVASPPTSSHPRGTEGGAAFHPAPSWPGWSSATDRPSPNLRNDFARTVSLATAQCSSSYPPWAWLAFDSLDGSFWAAAPSDCVDVINASAYGSVTASYPVGEDPFGVAIDTFTADVYVTNPGSNNVTVINGSTGVTVANITVGSSPYGVAYDPSTQDVYVANGGSDNLSIISGSTERVVGSVGVGITPIGVAVDLSTGDLFVANNGSANVSVLATSNNTVVDNVPTGQNPYGVALDNVSDQVYVTNRGSDTVTVINASNDSVAVTIGTGEGLSPEGVAYNPVNGLVWVGAQFYTVLINTTTQSVLGYLTTDPSGVAVDPTNGVVCATNTANATLRCMTYPNPIFPGYFLDFAETGLPATANWSVTLYWPGYYRSTLQNLSAPDHDDIGYYVFAGAESNYTYVIPPSDGYYPTAPSDTLSLSCEPSWPGCSLTINVTFVPLSETYPVIFTATGLAQGTSWNVSLGGVANQSSTDQIVFREPNGTYAFSVLPPPGLMSRPAAGNVTVNGREVDQLVTFVSAPTYPVEFNESGLPSGVAWSVSLNGVWEIGVGRSIEFNESNGTYRYVVGQVPDFSTTTSSGSVPVNGSAAHVSIAFSMHAATGAPFELSFTQMDLPSGTLWAVDLNGSNYSSQSSRIVFGVENGTYLFSVATEPGYAASPESGTIVVAGQDVFKSIAFTVVALPLSVNFSYAIQSATCLSNGGVTNFVILSAEATGGFAPYTYRWTFPAGAANGALVGTTTSYGANNSATVAATDSDGHTATHSAQLPLVLPPCPPPAPGPGATNSSSPDLATWAIIGGGVGLALVASALVLVRSRKGNDGNGGAPPGS